MSRSDFAKWLVVAVGAAIMLAARAHADPSVTPDVAVYAAKNSGAVCTTLTVYPSMEGIEGIAKGVMEDGFTAYQAGEVIALSVEASCPRFDPLLEEFVAAEAPKQSAGALA